MSYSYAQKHHNNYNRCYKNYPMKVDNTPINVNIVLIDNVQCYVYLGQRYNLKENHRNYHLLETFDDMYTL